MMKEYKSFFNDNKYLIALDLDGTLLNKENIISPSCIKYLKQLASYGNKIVLSSGRSDTNLLKFYNQLELNTPLISFNGSKITFPNSKKKSISYTINLDIINRFLSFYLEDDFVNLFGEDDNKIYFFKEYKLIEEFFKSDNKEIQYGSILDNVKNNLFSLIVLSSDTSKNEEMNKYLNSLNSKYHLRFWYDYPVFGEFYQDGVNKGNSLKRVASILKIKKENVISFGDGHNDIEMLKYANYPFAMKNGSSLLKKEIKSVTKYTNDEDGVVKTLQELFDSLIK